MGAQKEVLTAENIKYAFGANVMVKRHAVTNQCYLLPVPASKTRKASASRAHNADITVHLICGGGEGAPLLYLLSENGYNVTAGVVNLLDTDCEVAQLLGIPW